VPEILERRRYAAQRGLKRLSAISTLFNEIFQLFDPIHVLRDELRYNKKAGGNRRK
jgi:hypothetical protein